VKALTSVKISKSILMALLGLSLLLDNFIFKNSYAQSSPENLDFESVSKSDLSTPSYWTNFSYSEGYKVMLMDSGNYHGDHALKMIAKGFNERGESGGVLQTFSAKRYCGSSVTFGVFAKRDSGNGEGKIWLIVRNENTVENYVFNRLNPVTSSNWEKYEVTSHVLPDATEITIGLSAMGKCSLTFDGGYFEYVSDNVKFEYERLKNFPTYLVYSNGNEEHTVLFDDVAFITGTYNSGGFIILKRGQQLPYTFIMEKFIKQINIRNSGK
jgi:hypothetical protein